MIKLKYKEYKNIFIKTNDCMLIKRNKKSIENNQGGKSMLVEKNEAIEIIEEKMNFKFKKLKIIGYFNSKFGVSFLDKDENNKTIQNI